MASTLAADQLARCGPMVPVTARKVRSHDDRRSGGREYPGFLVHLPVVGRGLVLFRDPGGQRMITSPVRRILSESEGGALYVETENSVYRLVF